MMYVFYVRHVDCGWILCNMLITANNCESLRDKQRMVNIMQELRITAHDLLQ